MAHTLSERKVLKKLGISDFRYMTKDKVVQFASMLHQMDPRVAMKVLDQFPHYTQLATEMVGIYKDITTKILEANTSSTKPFYDACASIIATLQKELEDDDITSEERTTINRQMIEVAQMLGEKDTENKHFLDTAAKLVWGILAGVGISALAFIGIKVGPHLLGRSDEDDDDENYDA